MEHGACLTAIRAGRHVRFACSGKSMLAFVIAGRNGHDISRLLLETGILLMH